MSRVHKGIVVFAIAFAVCVLLLIVSLATHQSWLLLLALVIVPLIGWMARRANWLEPPKRE